MAPGYFLPLSHGRPAGWVRSASPVESGAHKSGFESHLWDIIATVAWTSDLTSLGLSFHIWKVGIVATATSQVCRADERRFGRGCAENGAWQAVSSQSRVILCKERNRSPELRGAWKQVRSGGSSSETQRPSPVIRSFIWAPGISWAHSLLITSVP